jgi:hypothetical protein
MRYGVEDRPGWCCGWEVHGEWGVPIDREPIDQEPIDQEPIDRESIVCEDEVSLVNVKMRYH